MRNGNPETGFGLGLKGPVCFRPRRVDLNGLPFEVFKRWDAVEPFATKPFLRIRGLAERQ